MGNGVLMTASSRLLSRAWCSSCAALHLADGHPLTCVGVGVCVWVVVCGMVLVAVCVLCDGDAVREVVGLVDVGVGVCVCVCLRGCLCVCVCVCVRDGESGVERECISLGGLSHMKKTDVS